mmetsp:Transcript_24156/g.66933  ORF Transcript_24156/g.66933 Transcript_24156/m.66933 type:complete len:310 (+) Transcript_24156:357-1286(+)
MTRAARFTSCSERVLGPKILNTTPVASCTGSSNSGLLMAAIAASSALVLPTPVPIPIKALPASFMTDRTSAKSTLIKPGRTIISEIPTTPCRRISSATRNAAVTGVSSGMISSSLLLLTIITVSTFFRKRSIASVACRILRLPSKANGLVTIATVNAPLSFAISATTGAAPDPVPPPMPEVMKHKSVPCIIAAMSAADSSAASSPIDGSPPAPSPRVTEEPMFNTFAPSALLLPKACASVLMAQYSTPPTAVSSIRSTALHPPPPTPKTRMTHGLSPPSGMSGSTDAFNPGTSFAFRNPRKVPLPLERW